MTNKIKPFCVDTEAENLSDEQIKQLHKWCVDAGSDVFEDVYSWVSNKNAYPLMGIDYTNDIISHTKGGHFNNNILKFQDVPYYLGVIGSEKSIPVETSVSPSDSFYTKLDTLLTLYPITLSKGISVTSTDIMITHDNFEHDFIVKNEEEILELLKSFDTLDKLADK